MKNLILAALLFAGAANADTLPSRDCGKYADCDAMQIGDDLVDVNANIGLGTAVAVDINGQQFLSPTGSAATITGLVLYASDGTTVTLNATFVQVRKLVHSGHNFYVTVWHLVSGSIVR